MLIQTHSRREGEVRAQAHEHTPPTGMVQIEVVVDDPARAHLQMQAIVLLVAVGDPDPARLAGAENGDDFVGLDSLAVRIEEIVAPSPGASNTGTPHLCDWLVTQFLYCSAMLPSSFRVTRLPSR